MRIWQIVPARPGSLFERACKKLAKDYPAVTADVDRELAQFQGAGALPVPCPPRAAQVPGLGHDVLKIRIPSSDQKRGKSGGFRLLLASLGEGQWCPVLLYAKTQMEDVPRKVILDALAEALAPETSAEEEPASRDLIVPPSGEGLPRRGPGTTGETRRDGAERDEQRCRQGPGLPRSPAPPSTSSKVGGLVASASTRRARPTALPRSMQASGKRSEQMRLVQSAMVSYTDDMPHFKATAFRLSPAELELMDALATKVGVISRAEVLRVAIRKLARIEGLQLPPPRKKRAPKAALASPQRFGRRGGSVGHDRTPARRAGLVADL